MKKLQVVFAHEFKETVKSKSFIVISILLLVVLCVAGVAVVGITGISLFGGGEEAVIETIESSETIDNTEVVSIEESAEEPALDFGSRVAVADKNGEMNGFLPERTAGFSFVYVGAKDDEQCRELLADDSSEYRAVLLLTGRTSYTLYEKSSMYKVSYSDRIDELLTRLEQQRLLGECGISELSASNIMDISTESELITVGDNSFFNYLLGFGMIILQFLCIMLYGQMVAMRVATEKSSRAMELLVTSSDPTSLLLGKVLGVGAAALMQIGLFLGALGGLFAFAASRSSYMADTFGLMFNIPASQLIYTVLYFVLGFTLMAFIYGAIGSLVSQMEDLQGLSQIPMWLFMIGYFIAIMSSTMGESNLVLRLCSFVPFWSPMIMSVRMTLETVPDVQIIISLALQLAATLLFALATTKIYRLGTLMYGKPPKLGEVCRMVFRRG